MADVQKFKSIDDLREITTLTPGAHEFVELAARLSNTQQERVEGREICFRGLSADPTNLRGRLTLARLYFLDEMSEFCVRELVELNRRLSLSSPNDDESSLNRLIQSFGELAGPYLSRTKDTQELVGRADASGTCDGQDSQILAEIDIETDFAELLDELEE